jgi:RNA polymerase sigma-70 factor (ECF subfamily)
MAMTANELIPTRATLLGRLKNLHNQASWQEFFDIYWVLIFGMATKHGLNQNEAEDVVQEVMADVVRLMPDFKYEPAKGSFKAWLLNLTRWRIGDQVRKRPPEAAVLLSAGPVEVPHAEIPEAAGQVPPDLEMLWEMEWEKYLLEAATTKARRRLDPKLYQIFDFMMNRSWPPEKVAKAMGVSLSHVYVARHRVADAIKSEFERLQKDII